MKQYKKLAADIGLVYSAAIWGSTFFVVKRVLDQIEPLALIAFRFLLAAFLLYFFLKLGKKPAFHDFRKGFFLSLILLGVYFPQTLGLKFTTAANSGFITGLFVVFVPFISWIALKKRPPAIKWISVFIAVCGLWILTGGISNANQGDYFTLVTALFYSLHIIVVGKYMERGSDPYILTFQQFLGIGMLSLFLSLFFESTIIPASGNVILVIMFLGIFPTLSAFLIQTIAQKITAPLKVAIIFSLEPLFAAIFSWTLGGEKFVLLNGTGGLLMVLAFFISELPQKKYL